MKNLFQELKSKFKNKWHEKYFNAILDNKYYLVLFYLNTGADIEVERTKAVIETVKNNNLKIIKYFIQKDVDIQLILRTALLETNFQIIEYCLEQGADIHDEIKLIFLANKIDVIKYYLSKYGIKKEECLFYLVYNLLNRENSGNNLDLIYYLLDNGVDVDKTISLMKTNKGNTNLSQELEKIILNRDLKNITIHSKKQKKI